MGGPAGGPSGQAQWAGQWAGPVGGPVSGSTWVQTGPPTGPPTGDAGSCAVVDCLPLLKIIRAGKRLDLGPGHRAQVQLLEVCRYREREKGGGEGGEMEMEKESTKRFSVRVKGRWEAGNFSHPLPLRFRMPQKIYAQPTI